MLRRADVSVEGGCFKPFILGEEGWDERDSRDQKSKASAKFVRGAEGNA